MTTRVDPLARLVEAWSKTDFHRKPITARKLIQLAGPELAHALRAAVNQKKTLAPASVGRWLSANRDLLAAGYRVRSKLDRKDGTELWYLEPMTAADHARFLDEERQEIAARPAKPERAFTIVAPATGSFVAHKGAERVLPHFAKLTATASVVRWLDGYAIELDTRMLEERGRTLDDLHAVAESLVLSVTHHCDRAPQSNAPSFWPSGPQYLGSLVERDPFALVEAEQRSRPVIPRGVLKFNV